MSRVQANLLLLLVALIWGSAFVAQVHGTKTIGPFTFTGIRFLIGACVIFPFAWRDYKAISRRAVKPSSRDVLGLLVLGLLLLLGAVFQQIGLISTSVTHAGFLTALYVPLVPLLSWLLLKERPHWIAWPTSLGCLVGTWLLAGIDPAGLIQTSFSIGDLWVIASSLFWALHVLWVGKVASRFDAPILVAAGQFLICGFACLLWAVFKETITLQGLQQAWLPILYTGVISVGIAYTGQVVGQRYANAADAAIILSAETLFAALFGFLLMGDRLSVQGMAGCSLIFVCIVAVQILPLLHAKASTRAIDPVVRE